MCCFMDFLLIRASTRAMSMFWIGRRADVSCLGLSPKDAQW